MRPIRSLTYTSEQVFRELKLRDSPFLRLYHCDKLTPIQTSHITPDELLSIPGFAELEWIYRYETDEWIPVFDAADDKAVAKLLNFEPWEGKEDKHLWTTPKMFPRKQSE